MFYRRQIIGSIGQIADMGPAGLFDTSNLDFIVDAVTVYVKGSVVDAVIIKVKGNVVIAVTICVKGNAVVDVVTVLVKCSDNNLSCKLTGIQKSCG